MATDQLLPVKLGHLELGLPLRYDVLDENGKLLASAGTKFTEQLRTEWSELGLSTLRIKVGDKCDTDADSEPLLRPYDPEVLERLEANLEVAKTAALSLASRLADSQSVNNAEFQELTSLLLKDIQQDSALALLCLFNNHQKPFTANDQMLSERCSQLSLLSMVIACELGLEDQECRLAGMAGLLHDISLMGMSPSLSMDDQQELYIQHSLKSAGMAESIQGIDPRVCMAVAQVHESMLGDGFPRGLHGARIMPLARIIHLADIYLTLTAQQQPTLFPDGRNLHPADGMGYIMYHAARGRFEVDKVKALIRAASLYPIGSRVRLSDETEAVVFRSSRMAPSLPVVQLKDQRLIDLRFSDLSILGPSRQSQSHNALQVSRMAEVLWA